MRFFLILLLIAGLVAGLFWRFPYVMDDTNNQTRLLYLLLLLGLVAGSIPRLTRVNFSQTAKMAGTWVAILIVLMLGYSQRDVLMGALVPNRVNISSDGAMTVNASEGGHFFIEAEVNGARVNFMVDTGATDIVLSPADAKRAGYAIDSLRYTRQYNTANGVVGGAPVSIGVLRVGNMVLNDMPASVNKAGMDSSLLGMRFLNEMQSYRVEGDTLTLVP